MSRPRQPAKPKPEDPSLLERIWPWLLRFVGVGIVLWELISKGDHPSLVLLELAAGMIGLPTFIHLDRQREKENGSNGR